MNVDFLSNKLQEELQNKEKRHEIAVLFNTLLKSDGWMKLTEELDNQRSQFVEKFKNPAEKDMWSDYGARIAAIDNIKELPQSIIKVAELLNESDRGEESEFNFNQ